MRPFAKESHGLPIAGCPVCDSLAAPITAARRRSDGSSRSRLFSSPSYQNTILASAATIRLRRSRSGCPNFGVPSRALSRNTPSPPQYKKREGRSCSRSTGTAQQLHRTAQSASSPLCPLPPLARGTTNLCSSLPKHAHHSPPKPAKERRAGSRRERRPKKSAGFVRGGIGIQRGMAPSCYDVAASMLLCAEDSSSILGLEEEEAAAAGKKRGRSLDAGFGVDLFPPQSEECVAGLVERETEHMPRADYGERIRGGGVDLCVRREAIDWIWKVYSYYNFGPLTAYLAVNYLDRFLSQYELPEGKAWMTQLLSVACLSLAAKMEETAVPQSLDLQVGEACYVFEAKTIQRMELLVLSTLNWRMQAVTPFSYVDYFLHKLNGGNETPSWLFQSAELILCIARGTGCLGFRPSEIAAAVAATVVGEVDDVVIAKACTHVDKERVLQCQEAIQSAMASINTVPPKSASTGRSSASSAPQSPIGVLDVGCLSYKSDDTTTIASHGSCCHDHDCSPVTSKRRKISR